MKQFRHSATPGPYIASVSVDRTRITEPRHYAFNLPAIRHLESLDLHAQVTRSSLERMAQVS